MSNQLKDDYDLAKPLYEKLATNICDALNTFLTESNISTLSVNYRIKDFQSYSEKAVRKNYANAQDDIEDICGIRIIAYFPDDIKLIGEIINSEFNVSESEVKEDLLNDDQFGYRSNHYIVTIKSSWLATPNYRGLAKLKAEIQIRTVLMHAWADLSHKLAYKSKEATPSQFLRNIYQLSALFELADERFEHLRKQKIEHINKISNALKFDSEFPLESTLNVDTIQAYLDYRFPNKSRVTDEDGLSNIIEEMNNCNITFHKLDSYYQKCKHCLEEMEKITISPTAPYSEWAQVGMVRMILDHLNSEYRSFRDVDFDEPLHQEVLKLIEKG